MAAHKKSTPAPTSSKSPTDGPEHPPASDRTHALGEKVRGLLESGRTQEAFDAVKGHVSTDPLLKSLFGVCLMRLGDAARAVNVFRELALASGSMLLRDDVPMHFKTNFATALLLSGNVSGAVSVLDDIGPNQDPRVQRLRDAVDRWASQLSLVQRLMWKCGVPPERPVTLDFPPGDLA